MPYKNAVLVFQDERAPFVSGHNREMDYSSCRVDREVWIAVEMICQLAKIVLQASKVGTDYPQFRIADKDVVAGVQYLLLTGDTRLAVHIPNGMFPCGLRYFLLLTGPVLSRDRPL